MIMKELCNTDPALHGILTNVQLHSKDTYVPSQFALQIIHNKKPYVYNTLTKQCIEGTLPTSTKAGEGYDEWINARFLVPSDKDECAYYNSISLIMRNANRKKGISHYTIMPTLGCNARCVYCFEEGMKQDTMTQDIAKQTIHYILNTKADGRIRLEWYGGEPLLCPEIIDQICKGLQDAGVEYRSSMISNGSLITSEIIKHMTREWKLESIQISLDGDEKDYIERKQYYSYNDDYHKVIESVSNMSEAGIDVTIRCNVDEENWDNMPRFMHDLKNGIENKEKVSFYFAPLDDVRRGDNDASFWNKVLNANSLVEETGLNSYDLIQFEGSFRIHHCTADGGSMYIGPDGSLYCCGTFPPNSRVGDIWNGITAEKEYREFCRVDRIREKCRKCTFLPVCTGFAACPAYDIQCREVQQMIVEKAVKCFIDKTEMRCADK